MPNKKNAASLGWRLFALSWIPFIGIFSYVFYPIEEWLPPVSIYCLVISMSMMISGIILILVSLSSDAGNNRQIRQTGERGQATIVSVEDSGTRINDHFVLNVGLRIAPAFGPTFETVCSQVIPIYHMAQIQKNNTVNVLYLKDSQEAVIDFE
jgi:hypothetical protein